MENQVQVQANNQFEAEYADDADAFRQIDEDIELLAQRWHLSSDAEQRPPLAEIAREALQLDNPNFALEELESNWNECLQHTLLVVWNNARDWNAITEQQIPEDMDRHSAEYQRLAQENQERQQRRERLRDVMDAAFHGFTALLSQRRYELTTQGVARVAPPHNLLSMRFSHPSQTDNTETKPWQNVLLFLLDSLYNRRLRRYNDACYKELLVNGHSTHAWVREMDIRQFVYSAITKEMQYEMWCAFTDTANNGRNAIEYLTHCVDWQFPQIKKDRNVFAFRNGIYVTKEDEFFPYPVTEDQLDPSVVACNFIDVPFQNYTSEDCDGDWYKIPTPNFQKILDYQNLSEEVSRWMYICMGRLLYRVNENDGWQIIPFIKGAAGSGKSTICKVAKDFYDVEDVGILSNNIERTFGLSQVFDKFLFIAPEIKRDFNLDQAEFQSMVSGEDLAIAIKNKTARTCLWETPGILAGNEVPEWVDNSGSISRRVLTFHFPKKVTQSDPDLSKKLRRELPALIKKCNVAYGSAVEEFGSNNIWTVLPKYFLEKQREMAESCNALQAFLSSDLVVKDSMHYVPRDQFVKAMQEFCVANSYPRPRFEKDFYSAIFDQHKLELRSDQLPYPRPNGEMRTRQYIIGVDLAVNLR